MTGSVSIIIPHYEDLANLDVCLSRLTAQEDPSAKIEIVVADNNSRCGLAAVEGRVAGRAKVILATEQGAGPARNAGVAASTGEILAFIDSDCVPQADWVKRGLAALAGADFIGGRVDVLPEHPGRLSPTEAFETVFAFDFESYVRKKGFTGSGNMFVSRATFDQVGGFRKTVSEDVDWSHRAVARGFRLAYAADVAVGHPARQNWSQLRAKWDRLVAEAYAYHRQEGGSLASWNFRALLVLASPCLAAFKVFGSLKLGSARDRIGALAVLFAIRSHRCARMIAAPFR